jgi:hypothetical protein
MPSSRFAQRAFGQAESVSGACARLLSRHAEDGDPEAACAVTRLRSLSPDCVQENPPQVPGTAGQGNPDRDRNKKGQG